MAGFASLVLAIGEKVRNDMKKKINYTDEPIQLGETVKDFLPSPSELALREKTIRVTLNLSEESVKFFKEAARQEGIPYQKLIRQVVDLYAQHHQLQPSQ